MRGLKLGTKINLIVVAILLALSSIIAYVAVKEMQVGIKAFATEKAKSDLNLVSGYLSYKHPGEWSIKEGKLYKGDMGINENNSLVDEISTMTGDSVTIFQGDTRVATNLLIEGERAIGTKVSSKVADIVLTEGEPYYGPAVVLGETYQAAYAPIRSSDGSIIGILYVGAEQSLIDVIIWSFINRLKWVVGGALVASMLIILMYMRKIRKRLARIEGAMTNAGRGDFTSLIVDHTKDEIGRLGDSFDQMKTSLKELIEHGQHAAEGIAASTQELNVIAEETSQLSNRIVQTMNQVAAGAVSQTQTTLENAHAMEEVAVGVQRMAESATEISESAVFSKQQAEAGADYVHKTVGQMETIHQSVEDTHAKIRLLDEKSREISGILGIIKGITSQTNLLALNASIEAARAGEHGRGFAVVANEVRKLAEQSSGSSNQVADLIHEMELEMQHSIASMEQAVKEVQTGIELAHETDRSLAHIVQANGHMAGQIEEMAATAEQMSAGIQQITAAVAEISVIAKGTSASSQEVATATKEQLAAIEGIHHSSSLLISVSDELQQSLSKFTI